MKTTTIFILCLIIFLVSTHTYSSPCYAYTRPTVMYKPSPIQYFAFKSFRKATALEIQTALEEWLKDRAYICVHCIQYHYTSIDEVVLDIWYCKIKKGV